MNSHVPASDFRPPADLWALVPVKRFALAKRRLAPQLAPPERAALAKAMLRHVLGVLAGCRGLAGILIVTSDPEAMALARAFGAHVLPDAMESGTNAAVRAGMAALDRAGKGGVIVVPGDVPGITRAEMDAVVDALASAPVVLVPATRDGGTNLLAACPPALMAPSFGPSSFARHLESARAAGREPCVLHLPGIGRDIDVSADLAALPAALSPVLLRARPGAALPLPSPLEEPLSL
ncbi:MAG: 2-phospho-L-lactate guanylyltransferase [Rhizobiales bacterium 24-66-13]|jgi:2-phospho-L-lactate guanylyltransferase|nr:MAG: 2-phospho-L-lactate guanylyltransferase [Rhizobiales bacterium 35-66-30]OYZ72083.1 MAG: 2-phospho-L-lactate guanylyltransferase [Rhizobiales bacterium 24-66-13]OZB04049.1 MAG: 2-phospho-L-lactate guanylyltransferase [Rhizobiales bacterium 39-66-18]HQS07920.1 2-phospho-L-lactate guanylyltransferase [Xanthobacteraceae bacterium]HQS45787.1 2-phospho-L-lactate guanylyltransferase [Xanthobacteraceae bacterium]